MKPPDGGRKPAPLELDGEDDAGLTMSDAGRLLPLGTGWSTASQIVKVKAPTAFLMCALASTSTLSLTTF
jgi:hypothetical protein